MNAIAYYHYGSPEVVEYTDIEKPKPKEDEVLVRVKAASVNPLDWHMMRGRPLFMRLQFGLNKPKHTRLGADLAGIVEAVGTRVTRFKIGDEVLGDMFEGGLGSLGEYAATSEKNLVLKPSSITFEEAAAIPIAAITALQGLRDTGHVSNGKSVLINGASGGVGTFAVQIAKFYGAEVTGVCSTRNVDLVKSIGADQVVDYRKEDFTQSTQKYDLIFDLVGNRTVPELSNALKPNGRCVLCGYQNMPTLVNQVLRGAIVSKTTKKKIGMMPTAHMDTMDLELICKLVEDGAIRSVIDTTYPLAKTNQAIDYLEQGHARGKVVIQVA